MTRASQEPATRPENSARETLFARKPSRARQAEGNKIEKLKLAKDPTNAWTDLYEFAGAIRAGTLDYARRQRPKPLFFSKTPKS